MFKYFEKVKVYVIFLLIIPVISCTSINSLKYGRPLEISEVTTPKFEADIEVGNEDVKGRATITRFFGFKIGGSEVADNITFTNGNSMKSSIDLLFSSLLSILSIVIPPDDSNNAKNSAALVACESAGCDILLIPRYNVKKSVFLLFGETTAEVTGRPGYIKGIKQIKNK
ncbi:MAG: hypothetical protein A2539_08535 [Elusimicrobia bacterium RIFOXYD2_FULL_34_15]|nr:MAG: hypothetical protein A2539_08535 [Elusimicrobia bacterium RIFOXYD2_FULL_34_15]